MRGNSHSRRDKHSRAIPVVGATAVFFASVLIITGNLGQYGSAVVIGAVLIGLAAMRPRLGIAFTIVYLAIMGDVRRYIVTQAGVTKNDPLLLVGPAVAAILMAIGVLRRRTMLRTNTSKLIVALMIIMTLEVLNPLQGGISVGLAGALFFLVPLMWFWVGQAWGDSAYLQKLLVRVVVPISICACLLGIMQATVGYLHFEAIWFRLTAESAARPDIRPFSFFCSWAEYPFYVGIALIVVLTPLFVGRVGMAFVAPLFIAALLIQGVREAILESMLALCCLWAVQGKSRAAIGSRLALAAAIAVPLLLFGMTALKSVEVDSEALQRSLTHSADGFLDIQNSTAGGHVELLGGGVLYGFTNPLGLGLGGPTIAGVASGGFASEIDFGDIFIACGFIGGLLNLCLIYVILRSTIGYWRDSRDLAGLYVIGIVVLQLGHWLSGGLYATSPITWFGIGAIDHMIATSRIPQAEGSIPRRGWLPARRSRVTVAG